MYTYIYFKDPIWSFEAILSSDIAKEATDSMLWKVSMLEYCFKLVVDLIKIAFITLVIS